MNCKSVIDITKIHKMFPTMRMTVFTLQAKMKWLRGEVRDRIKMEHALKKDLQEALSCNESDRHFLMSELAKRDNVLDELSSVKHGMFYIYMYVVTIFHRFLEKEHPLFTRVSTDVNCFLYSLFCIFISLFIF